MGLLIVITVVFWPRDPVEAPSAPPTDVTQTTPAPAAPEMPPPGKQPDPYEINLQPSQSDPWPFALLLIGIFGVLGLASLWRRRPQPVDRPLKGKMAVLIEGPPLPTHRPWLLPAKQLHAMADGLPRQKDGRFGRLDAPATVRATARAAGRVVLRRAGDGDPVQIYLLRDQNAPDPRYWIQWLHELSSALRQAGTRTTLGVFNSADATVSLNGRWRPLARISPPADARVILLTDGQSLPTGGQRLLNTLRRWRHLAMVDLTVKPPHRLLNWMTEQRLNCPYLQPFELLGWLGRFRPTPPRWTRRHLDRLVDACGLYDNGADLPTIVQHAEQLELPSIADLLRHLRYEHRPDHQGRITLDAQRACRGKQALKGDQASLDIFKARAEHANGSPDPAVRRRGSFLLCRPQLFIKFDPQILQAMYPDQPHAVAHLLGRDAHAQALPPPTTAPEVIRRPPSSWWLAAALALSLIGLSLAQALNEEVIPMRFVGIPAGEFMMGSTARPNEQPVHRVRLSGFWMAESEVTQAQYAAVMGERPSRFKDRANNPVESVRWKDAVRYCNALSEEEGLTPAYDLSTWARIEGTTGYRLPTEAEWEYAARAGTTTQWWTGDDEASLGRAAYYGEGEKGSTHPVMRKAPNAWGLYDVHGNVWEWCEDWYAETYPDPSPALSVDPTGPSTGGSRVFRGGSFWGDAESVRSAYRDGWLPDGRFSYVGFRLVRPAP